MISFANFLNFVSTCVTWIGRILDAVQKETVVPRCEKNRCTVTRTTWQIGSDAFMSTWCMDSVIFRVFVFDRSDLWKSPPGYTIWRSSKWGWGQWLSAWLKFISISSMCLFWIERKWEIWEIPAFLALLWTCECFERNEKHLAFWHLWMSGSRTLEALCCPCGPLTFSLIALQKKVARDVFCAVVSSLCMRHFEAIAASYHGTSRCNIVHMPKICRDS